MGGAVTMGHLIMASSDMPKGIWDFVGALRSGCEGLDDFLRPKVLALLAGVRRAELWGREEVALGVVGGLRVSYLCWGGPEGTLPSDGGMLAASGAYDIESQVNEESIWPPLVRTMSEIG